MCDKPPFTATVAHKLLGQLLVTAMVQRVYSVVSFTDEQGVRLSLCQECLTPRAIRSFADATSRVFTIQLNDPLGIHSVITWPVRGTFGSTRSIQKVCHSNHCSIRVVFRSVWGRHSNSAATFRHACFNMRPDDSVWDGMHCCGGFTAA